eukprot:CAMPEP_0172814272 /NCGR_PEP_ID=MMETSP1075-20121228/11148_1 /TAXON_ID=2916 /ORGANISM="Ceratium fusus, Strain PA161109" /LENGTH=43 /DNA_ID= /DNA_START= /DNA_END= /DNA_ORIENTATION=
MALALPDWLQQPSLVAAAIATAAASAGAADTNHLDRMLAFCHF